MDGTNDRALYLEDLAVGMRFVSATHVLDADEIKSFARQFDPQPFHLDEKAAEDTYFGGLAASGWHVAAITMKLLVGDGAWIAGGFIGAGGELAWPNPTRPGDALTVESEIVQIKPSRSRPDRGMVVVCMETRNQRGELAQVFTVNVLTPRRGVALRL